MGVLDRVRLQRRLLHLLPHHVERDPDQSQISIVQFSGPIRAQYHVPGGALGQGGVGPVVPVSVPLLEHHLPRRSSV